MTTARVLTDRRTVLFWSLLIAYTTTILIFLRSYLVWQSLNVVVGIAGVLLIWDCKNNQKGAQRFGWLALLALFVSALLPVKTMLFFTIILAMFYAVENGLGRVNMIIPAIMLMISPVIQYLVNVFSFPIRLKLSWLAARVFALAGENVKAMGNEIVLNGQAFAVDSACIGINMTTSSILLTLIIIGLIGKKQGKTLPFAVILVAVAAALMCNLISNLSRILLLVWFKVLPGNPFHGMIGWICFGVYVCVPVLWLSQKVVSRYGSLVSAECLLEPRSFGRSVLLQVLILAGVIALALHVQRGDKLHAFKLTNITKVNGYRVSIVNGDVIKLSAPQSLVYVKPIDNFYNSDHNPMICWTGSGYKQASIIETKIANTMVCQAVLKRRDELLYSAWWFDNGFTQTTSQLEWRWKMMQGKERFALINVTAASPQQLNEQISAFLQQRLNTSILRSIKKSRKAPLTTLTAR